MKTLRCTAHFSPCANAFVHSFHAFVCCYWFKAMEWNGMVFAIIAGSAHYEKKYVVLPLY